MRRRRFVRLLALGAVSLAGCGAGDSDDEAPTPSPTETTPESPTPRPEVRDLVTDAGGIDFAESETGTVLITIPVQNTADERLAAELVVEVEVGNERRSISRRVDVDAGATESYTLELDADWEEFRPNVRNVFFYEIG